MARQLSSQLEHEVRLEELVREQKRTSDPTPSTAATSTPASAEAPAPATAPGDSATPSPARSEPHPEPVNAHVHTPPPVPPAMKAAPRAERPSPPPQHDLFGVTLPSGTPADVSGHNEQP
jgi:hypothetical protein